MDKNKLDLLRAMLSGDFDPIPEHKVYNKAISNDLHKDDKRINRKENTSFQEQLAHFESLIDKALLNNLTSLTIIHGKGEGILRKALHKNLRKMDVVKKYHTNPDNSGETIIYFK